MARLIWAHSRIDAQIGDLRAGRESQGGCYLERERVVYMRELSFVGNYCSELTKHLNFPALKRMRRKSRLGAGSCGA